MIYTKYCNGNNNQTHMFRSYYVSWYIHNCTIEKEFFLLYIDYNTKLSFDREMFSNMKS